MTKDNHHDVPNKLIPVLWNSFYYVCAVYFFFAFLFFNENKTDAGKLFFDIVYNKHIELLLFALLLLRVSIVAETKECLHRTIWAFLLACYIIGCYINSGKITRMREIIIFGLIITASQINFNHLMVCIFTSYSIITIVKIVGSVLGYGSEKGGIRPLIMEMDFGRGMIETRYQFGFQHPNACHCAFFSLSFLLLYLLRKYRAKYIAAAVIFLCNFIVYHFTDSRTGLLIVIFALAAYLLFPLIEHTKKRGIHITAYVISQLLPFFAAGFTFTVGAIGLGHPGMDIINKFLTGRLELMNQTIASVPVTFFGTNFEITCDSNYIYTLYHCGIYVLLAYLLMHVLLIHFLYKNKMYEVIAIVTAFDIYFMAECTMLSLYRNLIPHFMIACSASYGNRRSQI